MINLASPNITEDDIASVVQVLRSGMLVQGKEVEALEEGTRVTIYVRVNYKQ